MAAVKEEQALEPCLASTAWPGLTRLSPEVVPEMGLQHVRWQAGHGAVTGEVQAHFPGQGGLFEECPPEGYWEGARANSKLRVVPGVGEGEMEEVVVWTSLRIEVFPVYHTGDPGFPPSPACSKEEVPSPEVTVGRSFPAGRINGEGPVEPSQPAGGVPHVQPHAPAGKEPILLVPVS